MGEYFAINGGNLLSGSIDVRGSKNAALPIIAATILTKEPCVISNVPLVQDVYLILDALLKMGASISWLSERTIAIENKNIDPAKIDKNIVRRMRASVLFIGPLLARFGKVEKMHYPGGCSIGERPIDVHLRAFENLGAEVLRDKDVFTVAFKNPLKTPHTVVLDEFSVTATENLLLLLAGCPSKFVIKIAAAEPHVADTARFIAKMGAGISGAGTFKIKVAGRAILRGARHKIIPDYIEAGTFLLAALSVGGKIRIRNAPASHLDLVIRKLLNFGATIVFNAKNSEIIVRARPLGLNSRNEKICFDKLQTMPYPGIPTDLQSAFAVFATQTFGETLVHEPLYEKRLLCLQELRKMGAKIRILDPHRAVIFGPTALRGAEIYGKDIRSVAALITAGLAARGATKVYGAEFVKRGYENLDSRLRALGADIKIINTK